MEHTKHRHLLANLWESYPDAISRERPAQQPQDIAKELIDILVMGPYYLFLIDVCDYSITQVSENALTLHGLSELPQVLHQIIELIHPDDIDYVLQAEKATLDKIAEIGFENQLFLKTSYCFRMRVADGSYHLFHHQAIRLTKDKYGRIATVLNIHTDIQHITQVNNRIALLTGKRGRDDYFQIDLSCSAIAIPKLSNREMEVLGLVSRGLSSQQIADKLFISPETVRVHRRNLLKKTNSHNKSTLLRQCMEWGLI